MTENEPKTQRSYENVGRKSLFEKYLEENPIMKRFIAEVKDLPDNAQFTDIFDVDQLIRYGWYELTRTCNENQLRGKTFGEYAKTMSSLLEIREKLLIMKQEAMTKEALAVRNRDEAEAFIKIVLEAITTVVEDLPTRTKISKKIQELYDRDYPEQPTDSGPTETSVQPAGETEIGLTGEDTGEGIGQVGAGA